MLVQKMAAWSASTRRTRNSPDGRPGAATRRGPACTKRKSEPVAADREFDVPRAASDPGRVWASPDGGKFPFLGPSERAPSWAALEGKAEVLRLGRRGPGLTRS